MIIKPKHLILFLGLCSFYANISGAVFAWHSHTESDCEDHDCEHCHICQTSFINSAKVIIDAPLVNIFSAINNYQVDIIKDAPVITEHPTSSIPRAPPA